MLHAQALMIYRLLPLMMWYNNMLEGFSMLYRILEGRFWRWWRLFNKVLLFKENSWLMLSNFVLVIPWHLSIGVFCQNLTRTNHNQVRWFSLVLMVSSVEIDCCNPNFWLSSYWTCLNHPCLTCDQT